MVADLDCNINSLAVEWRGSVRQTDTYSALAIGSDSTRASCNTTGTNCTIQSLRCGLTYNIVVITSSVNCGSIEGSDYSLQSGNCVSFGFSTWVHEARSICECPLGGDIVPKYTNIHVLSSCLFLPSSSAPCKPETAQVNLECKTNTALVTWENVGPDQTQVVSAVNSRGAITTCNSSSSNCTFDQLTCGETYVINVVSHTNTCSSEPVISGSLSTGIKLLSPCWSHSYEALTMSLKPELKYSTSVHQLHVLPATSRHEWTVRRALL